MNSMRIIGIMSGTSLDGIDMVCVDFDFSEDQLKWDIIATSFFEYDEEWRYKLANAHLLSATDLLTLDVEYGQYLGHKSNTFIQEKNLSQIDAIASHGHTIFHQPNKKFTLQIGHGAHIQAITKFKVISDFRSQDVALGGQGAPLVPIGDRLLFADYNACVNLGGFANISFDDSTGKRIAFDICPVNFVLNSLCREIGMDYDFNGEIASKGIVDSNLLNELNSLPFYQQSAPKSLGREWVETHMDSILSTSSISIESKIATFTQHVAYQIAEVLNENQLNRVLFSGGGAKNLTLISHLENQTQSEIIITNNQITDYKEALIFALLGALKLKGEINILSSVTGASRDSSGGIIYS
ncbi:anhydro-N-acetylmuramic acid kinase [Weeksellaceae bacterium KMM 9713]|uniref:Anhydro-N-acetylmuramic acid kinase n=1 Tax=Profundicola chukchiensis TaxID=2961959 RepID=A0A9X4RV64_9FLAO|nr:anhydro-N-acetylmuramic acid kinase [Profundicola chukchiensis]MDG4945450.1 anhydro-N-acetylmuramic acid kinase [Profundicola chukchiensis]